VWGRAGATLAVVVVLLIAGPSPASAYSGDCADDAINIQLCERAESAADSLDAIEARQEADSERLDLIWWGVWAAVGALFGLMAAPMIWKAFRFWSE